MNDSINFEVLYKASFGSLEGSYEMSLSDQTFSWNWINSFLKNFWHSIRNPHKVVCDKARSLKLGKIYKKGPIYWISGKFGHSFFQNLSNNESLYYLLCSCAKPIFEKDLVPEIWVKVLSPNQIAGFLNHRYISRTK